MTKPDSTDAGGVTHVRARAIVAGLPPLDVNAELLRYIDAQEAALATLTRERDELRELVQGKDDALAELRANLRAELSRNKWCSPPAPLPGGQGPVEALRRELCKALREVEEANPGRWFYALADRLEQGGEGREG